MAGGGQVFFEDKPPSSRRFVETRRKMSSETSNKLVFLMFFEDKALSSRRYVEMRRSMSSETSKKLKSKTKYLKKSKKLKWVVKKND